MALPLLNSPADILRWLLIDMGLGSEPAIPQVLPWPVFATNEPDEPENCLTCFDTEGQPDGRTQPDGEYQQHYGIQIRCRSGNHPTGYQQLQAIAIALDQTVNMATVLITPASYVVWVVDRRGDVIPIGKDVPKTKRSIFTVNVVAAIRRTI